MRRGNRKENILRFSLLIKFILLAACLFVKPSLFLSQSQDNSVARYTFNNANINDETGHFNAKGFGVSFVEDRFGNPKSTCFLHGNYGRNLVLSVNEIKELYNSPDLNKNNLYLKWLYYSGALLATILVIFFFVVRRFKKKLEAETVKNRIQVRMNEMDTKRILCINEDNGVGRECSATKKYPHKNRSWAMDFIKQRLELISKSVGVECGYSIINKKADDGSAEGTIIKLIIPMFSA